MADLAILKHALKKYRKAKTLTFAFTLILFHFNNKHFLVSRFSLALI